MMNGLINFPDGPPLKYSALCGQIMLRIEDAKKKIEASEMNLETAMNRLFFGLAGDMLDYVASESNKSQTIGIGTISPKTSLSIVSPVGIKSICEPSSAIIETANIVDQSSAQHDEKPDVQKKHYETSNPTANLNSVYQLDKYAMETAPKNIVLNHTDSDDDSEPELIYEGSFPRSKIKLAQSSTWTAKQSLEEYAKQYVKLDLSGGAEWPHNKVSDLAKIKTVPETVENIVKLVEPPAPEGNSVLDKESNVDQCLSKHVLKLKALAKQSKYYCKWPSCQFTSTEFESTSDHIAQLHMNYKLDSINDLSVVRNITKRYMLMAKPVSTAASASGETPNKRVISQKAQQDDAVKKSQTVIYPCPELSCGQRFDASERLVEHLQVHRAKAAAQFVCTWPMCSTTTTDRASISHHIRSSHKLKPYTRVTRFIRQVLP